MKTLQFLDPQKLTSSVIIHAKRCRNSLESILNNNCNKHYFHLNNPQGNNVNKLTFLGQFGLLHYSVGLKRFCWKGRNDSNWRFSATMCRVGSTFDGWFGRLLWKGCCRHSEAVLAINFNGHCLNIDGQRTTEFSFTNSINK